MNPLVYRTDDGTRWGSGQGSDLDADVIDINFWELYSAVLALQDHSEVNAQIVSMHAVGDQLYVTLSDSSVIGPITIPTASWNFRKEGWQPATVYAAFDVFNNNGSTYLVLAAHTSASTFSPTASSGTQDLYGLLLESPQNMLPDGGTLGQRLVKSAGSPFQTEWVSDLVRLCPQILGAQPLPNELVMQFICVDYMTLPAGLEGSVVYQGVPSETAVSWTLSKNDVEIGSVDFDGPSPYSISVNFSPAVECVPGDVITLNAPADPDSEQADVSFTIVARLHF